jgi:hypothetical protein
LLLVVSLPAVLLSASSLLASSLLASLLSASSGCSLAVVGSLSLRLCCRARGPAAASAATGPC